MFLVHSFCNAGSNSLDNLTGLWCAIYFVYYFLEQSHVLLLPLASNLSHCRSLVYPLVRLSFMQAAVKVTLSIFYKVFYF